MSGEIGLVVVDVGNSAVKVAVQRATSIADYTVEIAAPGWQQSAIGWVREQLSSSPAEWRIASVHRAAAELLESAIGASDLDVSIRFVTRHDVPMRVEVDHPDRVGIDRILSAFAARSQIDKAIVVVDAGSAVTVDWVNQEGHFCGGAILPGIELQARALASGTDKLPAIEWASDCEIELPAKNTTDAIRSGILAGISAGVDGLIERYRMIAGVQESEVHVVLTGGDGPRISRHLRHLHQIMPNLVCRGLLDLPRSEVGQTRIQQESR